MGEQPPQQIFPLYDEWLLLYNGVRDTCNWPEAIKFVMAHPETVNNRNRDSRGFALLHQGAFWGIDMSIVQQFKDLGADPMLRVYEQNFTPAEKAQAEAAAGGRRARDCLSFVQALTDVYGTDFAERRERLCRAAKDGCFPKVIQILTERPELTVVLAKVQTEGGWSLLHHAAFYEAGHCLYRRLRSLGCSAGLRTQQGESCEDILRKYHGEDSFSHKAFKEVYLEGAAAVGFGVPIAVGADISFYAVNAGMVCGKVLEVTDDEVSMTEAGGLRHTGPRWRFRALPPMTDDDDEEEKCCVCDETTSGRKASARCRGDHFLCSECSVTALKASWASGSLPLACSICDAELDDKDFEIIQTRRPFIRAWTETRSGTFPDFIARRAQKKRVGWEALSADERTVCQHMIDRGELMRCLNPACGEPFENLSGKNWAQCYFCKTEHCWQTKMLRHNQFELRGCGGTHDCH